MKILDQNLYFGKFSLNDRLEITESQRLKTDVRVVKIFDGGLNKEYFHCGIDGKPSVERSKLKRFYPDQKVSVRYV
jgi:hypothetical protein